jgi:hypothetical protein
MKHPKQFLPFAACLVALSSTLLVTLPAQSAEPNPSSWRFRSVELSPAPQTFTVSDARGDGWFVAVDERGRKLSINLPPKFNGVRIGGQWVPAWRLRAGDRVEVWGMQHGSRYHAAWVRRIDALDAAEQTARLVR